MVARRRHLPGLPAQFRRQQYGRHRRPPWHHRETRLHREAWGGLLLGVTFLQVADEGFRLRYHRLLRHPALRAGSIRFIDAPDNALAFVREHEKERILAAFNLSADPASIPLPSGSTVSSLAGHGFTENLSERQIQLPPYGAFFGSMKP